MAHDHHRKRDAHDEHKGHGAPDPGRQQGGAKGHGSGKPGAGNRALLASESDKDSDEDKDRDEDEDRDGEAGDEESGPKAKAAGRPESLEDIEDNIKDAWDLVKRNEAGIVRGLYDDLRDNDRPRSAGFFQQVFNSLTGAGVSALLSKVHPSAAISTTLIAVFNAAKSSIAEKLKGTGGSKIKPSKFLEDYVTNHINAGWFDGATKLETEMNKYKRGGLRSLRKNMRILAKDSSRNGAAITNNVLDGWLAALNREHKREEKRNDFATETSGRLHLERVHISPDPNDPNKFKEKFHDLTARVDGTGGIRNKLLERPMTNMRVPITVLGEVDTFGTFSFGVGSDQVPKPGPSEENGRFGLTRYAKDKDYMVGINKMWNAMKNNKLADLVGDNKKGGKTEEIQGSKDD